MVWSAYSIVHFGMTMVAELVRLWFLEFQRTEQPGNIHSLDQIVVRLSCLAFGAKYLQVVARTVFR